MGRWGGGEVGKWGGGVGRWGGGEVERWGGGEELTRSGTITLKPFFLTLNERKTLYSKKESICQRYKSPARRLAPSLISALKHMRVCRYSCFALF